MNADAEASLAARLAPHYGRFRVGERLLLTGHSHQAWPDAAFDGQQQAWFDAAALVDDKWGRAEEIARTLKAHWLALLGGASGGIALGENTHELVTRVLSAVLPLFGGGTASPVTASPRAVRTTVVTTDGEFHTIRRQLDRLAEDGLPVVKVAARPVTTLAERLAAAVDDGTACVLVSSVLFGTAEIVPGLPLVAEACERRGATLVVDAYHQVNVVPFDPAGLDRAFIVGGGYKYCQFGEGNAFLRVPDGCRLRPALTGWFSEFGDLTRGPGERVTYPEGAERFNGATYDPTAHYRADRVVAFHREQGLTPERLRRASQRQTRLLVRTLAEHDLDPRQLALVAMPPDARAGFVALEAPRAADLVARLRARGVYADARGTILRLGPAPYVTDRQLVDAAAALAEIVTAA